MYKSPAMDWLPDDLPANARLILSSLPCPALESLRKRRRPPVEVPLPVLSRSDFKAIIEIFLARYRKTLEPNQCAALLKKPDAGTPLYLLVALEELRTLGTYKEITDSIRKLPGGVKPMFVWILKRLEKDEGFRDCDGNLIGAELVRKFVSSLCVSRYGLSQQELTELIAPGNAQVDPSIPADPQGNLAALQLLL